MADTIQITLDKAYYKKATNKKKSLTINFQGNKKLLPEYDYVEGSVSAFERYNKEREECQKLRLTLQVNALCSNVLFNPITEIVKDEGSSNVQCLNYSPTIVDNAIGVTSNYYNQIKGIRDTQLSNSDCGYDYNCGVDIFNNHILRQDSYKCVRLIGYDGGGTQHREYFNTIMDKMVDEDGSPIYYDNVIATSENTVIEDGKGCKVSAELTNNGNRRQVTATTFTKYYGMEFGAKIHFEKPLNEQVDVTLTLHLCYDFTAGTISSTEKVFNSHNMCPNDIYGVPNYGIDGVPYVNDCEYKTGGIDYTFSINGNGNNDYNVTISAYTFASYSTDFITFWEHIGGVSDGKYKILSSDTTVRTISKGKNYDYYANNPSNLQNDSFSTTERYLYEYNESMYFKEAIQKRLVEDKNTGWYGFYNRVTPTTFLLTRDFESVDSLNGYTYKKSLKKIDIDKVINNKEANEFIDMYPDRSLYSFVPKINNFKKRIEKNWNYCLTYPSSSTTSNFEFLNEDLDSLKAVYFDDTTVSDNGINVINIYSMAQHGLKVGDYVNVYKTYNGYDDNEEKTTINELILENSEVLSVIDKYTFQIYRKEPLTTNWVYYDTDSIVGNKFTINDDTSDTDDSVSYEEVTYNVDMLYGNRLYKVNSDKKIQYYYIVPATNMVCLDETCQNISFKKVVDNVECSYYVRIFSRLPNFKYVTEEINENTLYKKNNKLISNYSDVNHDFENHVSSLAFSKNIYGDSIAEIVYSDDIDISNLKDNLGRPLTELYFTIVKNNQGYKQWYGKNERNIDIANDNIEFSHCFGKVSGAFLLSDSYYKAANAKDARIIGTDVTGLDYQAINDYSQSDYDSVDEIIYDKVLNYYGDLCCYSPANCYEYSIQPVMHRFNTAQREVNSADKSYQYFKTLTYDDFDKNPEAYRRDVSDPRAFIIGEKSMSVLQRKEGYYYRAHYQIPIRTTSSTVSTEDAIQNTLYSLKYNGQYNLDGEALIEIVTDKSHGFVYNSKFDIYSMDDYSVYHGKVSKIISSKKIYVVLYDENENIITDTSIFDDIDNFVLCSKDSDTTPSYANLSRDGMMQYIWREIVSNGNDNAIEAYPFLNGCLYVNKPINLYLRRQDPHEETRLSSHSELGGYWLKYEPESDIIESETEAVEDEVTNEEDILEC